MITSAKETVKSLGVREQSWMGGRRADQHFMKKRTRHAAERNESPREHRTRSKPGEMARRGGGSQVLGGGGI